MSDIVNILQIDDDKKFFNLSEEVLGSDFKIHKASSYETGMALLKVGSFDLALVNLNLTKLSDKLGLDILEYIRDNLPDMPRIVITGSPISGSIFGEYQDIYNVTDLLPKSKLQGYHLRKAVNRALNRKKLSVSVGLRHARLSRYLTHYYQKDVLKDYPKLQLLDIQVTNPRAEEAEITIIFPKQPPFIQETFHTIKVRPGKSNVPISPVFTATVNEGTSIAVNLKIREKNHVIWETDNSLLIEVVDTMPIVLKYVATGDQWMHFLVMACITPQSLEVVDLSAEVRNGWKTNHPGEKWPASNYTQKNAMDIVRILRGLLHDRLTCEGTYIPSVPVERELVEHAMRMPDEILQNGGANCLYYSLLYASVLENLGISPILLFMPGHVILGWKSRSCRPLDIRDITKMATREIINEECIFLESTGTSLSNYTFEQMLETGRRISADAQMLYLKDDSLPVSLIDVSHLRAKGLQPYNVHS